MHTYVYSYASYFLNFAFDLSEYITCVSPENDMHFEIVTSMRIFGSLPAFYIYRQSVFIALVHPNCYVN